MDAGTIVALVLGSVGFAWGAGTFFINRHDAAKRAERERDDEKDRRWLVDKRLIYAKAQAALGAQLETITRTRNEEGFDGRVRAERRASLFSKMNDGWEAIDSARGALDLLAREDVQNAMDSAAGALAYFGWVTTEPEVSHSAVGQAAQVDAVRLCARALNAMRADLGLGPVNEYAAMSDEERKVHDARYVPYPTRETAETDGPDTGKGV